MKTFKSLLAVSLFVVGLSFTSCSSDDDYIAPEGTPEQPLAPGAEHPIAQPPTVAPA